MLLNSVDKDNNPHARTVQRGESRLQVPSVIGCGFTPL
ncbi:hypothetical protein IJ21_14030 [Paenibacillus sp. 32O-W]|nr:hypothetical protein IJ21_14030 [Paenibacillus sp. 32O-W]